MNGLRLAMLVSVLGAAMAGGACTAGGVAHPAAFPRSQERVQTPGAGRYLPATDVVGTALQLRGVRYQFGGARPSEGFDCSGLVQYVFEQHGVALPRTAAEQYRAGSLVRMPDLAAGDLVFFSTIGPGPTHVGIVTGAGTFVHAPDTGTVVREERFDTPYWSSRFLAARRVAQSLTY